MATTDEGAKKEMGAELTVQKTIQSKLEIALQPDLFYIENESHMHGGPATESHFKLTVVAAQFGDQSPVKRHQTVYKLLANELAAGVHALSLHLYTVEEWEVRGQEVPSSPDCRGGSKSA